MQTSFCCNGVRYCSGVGGLMPWLSLHSVYFMERLQGTVHQRWGMQKAGGVQSRTREQPNYLQLSLCHQPF